MQNEKIPTWEQLLPSMLYLLEEGNKAQKDLVKGEILRMAIIADLYNASIQKGGSDD